MPSNTDLLRRIRENAEVSAFLAQFPGFDVNRRDNDDEGRLASGALLAALAGDFTGGAFYLCGGEETAQPVLYASSEGDAGVIARSLPEALELMIGLPYWRDCLTYSNNGDLVSMESAATLLQEDLLADRPDSDTAQTRAAELIGLTRQPIRALVRQLHEAVSTAGPEFEFSDTTGAYGPLFGPFEPNRNRHWEGRIGEL